MARRPRNTDGSENTAMRTLKQRIGFALVPDKSAREEMTSTLYHQREDGSYVAVEVKGIVRELPNDYLYVSVLRPVSMLAQIDGDNARVITGTDQRAVTKAAKELAEILERPKKGRTRTAVQLPDAAAKAIEKAMAALPEGYTLAFDKEGKPTLKRKRQARKPKAEATATE